MSSSIDRTHNYSPSPGSVLEGLTDEQKRQFLRVDLAKRWQSGNHNPVEALLEVYPSVRDEPELVWDLLAVELSTRKGCGERISFEEYSQRYPQCTEQLRRYFDVQQSISGTEAVTVPIDGRDRDVTLAKKTPILEPGETIGAEPCSPDTKVAATPQEIANYEILGELGRGGMGVVYKAKQKGLNRLVALKMILHADHASEDERQRFHREAQAIALLDHPNIVQIYDIGEHDGKPFFSLELVQGGSLEGRLEGTPLTPTKAAQLVETLAKAMSVAHGNDIIHRDLKPANVLLTEDGTPKITDFGLAKNLEEASKTQSGAIMGTPSYMAPEQAEGQSQQAGPLIDVYALGAILYECLTGRPPFKAPTTMETLLQVLSELPVSPSQLQAGIPQDIETICLKCLEKDPGKRYSSAQALANDLCHFQEGKPIQARPVGKLEKGWRWCRRNPVISALILVVIVVLTAGAGVSTFFAVESTQNAKDEKQARVEAQRNLRSAEEERDRAQRLGYVATMRLIASDLRPESPNRYNKINQLDEWLNELPAKLRSWEWGYVHRTLHGSDAILPVNALITSLLVSKDGRWLFAGTADKEVLVWDLTTRRKVLTLPHVNQIQRLILSPGGAHLAAWAHFRGSPEDNEEEIRVWKFTLPPKNQTPAADLVLQLKGDTPDRFSKDNQRFVSLSSSLRLPRAHDLRSGRLIEPFPGNRIDTINHSFTAEGDQAAVLTKDGIGLWDPVNNKQLGMLPRELTDMDVERIRFSHNDRHIIVGLPLEIEVWNREGEKLTTLRRESRLIDHILVGKGEKRFLTVDTYHRPRWRKMHIWEGDKRTKPRLIQALHFTEKTLIAQVEDFSVQFWDLDELEVTTTLRKFSKRIDQMLVTPDQQRLVTYVKDDSEINVWRIESGHLLATFLVPGRSDPRLQFTADHQLLWGSSRYDARGQLYVWKMPTDDGPRPIFFGAEVEPTLPRVLRGHTNTILAVVERPQASWISGGADGTIRIWNRQDPIRRELSDRGYRPFRIDFRPDGGELATSGLVLKGIKTLECETGRRAREFPGTCPVWSPSQPLLANVLQDRNGQFVELRSTKTNKVVKTFNAPKQALRGLTFSPDGLLLVGFGGNAQSVGIAGSRRTSQPGEVVVWEVKTGNRLAMWAAHPAATLDGVFSPDGKILATCAGGHRVDAMGKIAGYWGEVKLWDMKTRKEIGRLSAHSKQVNQVAFNINGTQLGTVSNDGTARIWDVKTGNELFQLKGQGGSVNTITFSPDGKRIVTGGSDSVLRLWDTTNGRQVMDLPQNAPVLQVRFSPDGKWLAAAVGDLRPLSTKNKVILWKADQVADKQK